VEQGVSHLLRDQATDSGGSLLAAAAAERESRNGGESGQAGTGCECSRGVVPSLLRLGMKNGNTLPVSECAHRVSSRAAAGLNYPFIGKAESLPPPTIQLSIVAIPMKSMKKIPGCTTQHRTPDVLGNEADAPRIGMLRGNS
jgi:hypothetical protein